MDAVDKVCICIENGFILIKRRRHVLTVRNRLSEEMLNVDFFATVYAFDVDHMLRYAFLACIFATVNRGPQVWYWQREGFRTM